MTRPCRHRLLAALLAALALLWPVPPPAAALGTELVASATTEGCPGCDRNATHGLCPALACAVPPALLPGSLPTPAAAGRTAFVFLDHRARGRVPDVPPPPPRAPLQA